MIYGHKKLIYIFYNENILLMDLLSFLSIFTDYYERNIKIRNK